MLWLLALILFACSLIQGAAGFAFGVFAVPLLVWAGVDLSPAVILVVVTAFIQTLWGSVQLRTHITWPKLRTAWLIRTLSLPLGVYSLSLLDGLNTALLKQILAFVLLLIVLSQVLWRVPPREQLHPLWGVLSFSVSGLLMGMVSMGGPPVVLWVMAQQWPAKDSRAFLMALFLLTIPVQFVLLVIVYQSAVIAPSLQGLLLSPVVLLGVTLGVRVGDVFSKAMLRQVSYLLLSLIAFSSLLSSWLS